MADEIRSDLPSKPDNEIAAPDPDARKEFESREKYRGFKMPRGMSLPQRRAWRKSIDERIDPEAKKQRKAEVGDEGSFWRGVGESGKEAVKEMFKEAEVLPELGKTVGSALIDAATVVPRTKAAIQSDPKGSLEFAKKVMSGDREAIRTAATEASEGIAEPFSTIGDAALSVDAAERGDYGTAALYGGLILAPAVLQTLGKSMSKGWLKSATEAGEEIPDEAARKMNDLAKRVDEGKVTDDMQVRREIAAIEDDHMVEYAKSRPIEDPLQKGGPEPGFLDPDARYDFDREPPGYMGMSRSNQPMSRFSEGHERFIDELRTDMAEDTNFGAVASRFYDDLESIDKREDLLRSTGKDAGGRQLDDIEISNEYEKLSKERQSLANEYYVAKAEREAELRHEGSYVPRGTPSGGRSVDDKMLSEISTREAFGRTSGGRLFKLGDGYIEAADLEDAARLATDDDGFYHYVFARGIDEPVDIRSVIKEASPEESAKYFDLKRQDPRGIKFLERSRGGTPGGERKSAFEPFPEYEPSPTGITSDSTKRKIEDAVSKVKETSERLGRKAPGGGGGAARSAINANIFAGQKLDSYSDYERSFFDHLLTDTAPETAEAMKYTEDLFSQGKLTKDQAIREYRIISRQVMFDDAVDPSVAANFDRPQTMYDRAKESGTLRVRSDYKMGTWSDQYRKTGYTQAHEDKYRLLDQKLDGVYSEAERLGIMDSGLDDFVERRFPDMDEYLELETVRMREDIRRRSALGGSRSIDDLEGPSESEIQQMVETSRFGDPEELEMLKEDMRRMAELEQGAQIESGRVRSTRTPGTPGASGKIPEGTSRAERKGGKRDRPKPKTKKDKYEN